MAQIQASANREFYCDTDMWHSLKRGIAATSGFKRWQSERLHHDIEFKNTSLDQQIQGYLRETLETLAY